MISNKSLTLPFENGKDITCIALSPDDRLLITIDEGKTEKITWPSPTCSANPFLLSIGYKDCAEISRFDLYLKKTLLIQQSIILRKVLRQCLFGICWKKGRFFVSLEFFSENSSAAKLSSALFCD